MTIATRSHAADSATRPLGRTGSSRLAQATFSDAALPQDLRTALLALPVLESLEGRQMMAASQSGSVITLSGNASSANNFDVRITNNRLTTTVNGAVSSFANTTGLTVSVSGGSSTDTVTFSDSVTARAIVNTFGGNDSVRTGSGNDTVYAGTGTDRVNGGPGADLAYDAEDVSASTGLKSSTAPTSPTTPVVATPTTFPTSPTNSGSIRRSGVDVYVTGKESSSNSIKVTLDSTGKKLLVQNNADAATYNVTDVQWIRVTSGSGTDMVDVASNVSARLKAHLGSGNDTVRGGAGADSIWTDGGNDVVDGRGGGDWINVGSGNDVVYGGTGADNIDGSEGNDSLDGGSDNDKLFGGNGTDVGVSGESRSSIETIRTSTAGWVVTGTTTTPVTNPTTGGGMPTTGGGTTTPTTGGTTGTGTGGATGAQNPTQTGNVANPVARITSPTGLSITAGHAVHVDGLSSSLNHGQAITARYEWDFGDSNSRFNKMVGFNAAHVYDRPGNYTVTLRVINEGGKTSTTTATVNVAADNRTTYYVSNSGSDSNSGSASSPLRTFNAAAAKVANASNVKILFARGQTFNVSTTSMWIRGDNISIGTYGSGAKPILKYVGPRDAWRAVFSVDAPAEDVDINGFTFDSIYNSTDGSEDNMPVAVYVAGKNVVSRNNTMLDMGFGHNVRETTMGLLVQDNESPKTTGLRAYFMWVEGSNIVAVGNKVANSTRQHVIRVSGATRVNVSNNDLSNLKLNNADQDKGVIVFQKGSYYYAASNKLRGPSGFGPLGLADGLNDKSARTVNGVFESNYTTGAHFEIRHGGQHINIRNNVFERHDAEAILLESYSNLYGRGSMDIIIANNTGINNSDKGSFIRVHSPVEGVKVLNNLYVAPNLIAGAYGSSGIAVFGSNLSSFSKIDGNNWGMPTIHSWADGGINTIGQPGSQDRNIWQSPSEWNAYSQVGTDTFTDITLGSGYKPNAGQNGLNAPAIGGVFTDFHGNYRTGTWSVGAVEV